MNEIEEWFYRTYIHPDSEFHPALKKVRGEKPILYRNRCSVCGWAICNTEVLLSEKYGVFPHCIYCLKQDYDLRYLECGLAKNDWRYRFYE